MTKPLIVEVHSIIKPNLLENCKEEIIEILTKIDKNKYSIVPLYVTSDVEDTEMRICFQIEDPVQLEKVIVEKFRKINGIISTRVRLTLNGKIFKKGVSVLAERNKGELSCHIFLKVNPKKDYDVWESLSKLKDEKEVYPTWIFRDFYDYDRDITLRLMGANVDAIKKYIDRNVGSIDGVEKWNFKFMYYMRTIISKDELLELAKKWLDI